MRGRPRNNDIPSEDYEKVIQLYLEGTSLKDLAKLYEVTPYVVKQLLYEYDVDIKPRGRPRKGTAEAMAELLMRTNSILTNKLGDKHGT